MAGNKPILAALLLASMVAGEAFSTAQTTGRTVRHHKVPVEDPAFPPELLQAETALEKKDYATAEPLLNKVVQRNPSNYRAWYDLGFVYTGLGRTPEAIDAYRKSVTAKPDVFESNLNLGLLLDKANQPGAEQYLRAATKLKPLERVPEGQAQAWLALGHLLEASRPDEALAAYGQAAVLLPRDPQAHLAAGPVLEEHNRFAEAEQEYKQALALDPKSTDALVGIADIYTRGNRYLEAENVLRQLLSLHPDYTPARLQLARTLAADGKHDAAMAELQTVLNASPGNTAVQRELAALYTVAGHYQEAGKLYVSLLAGNPNDAELHAGLGQAYLKQRRFNDAQQQLLTAVELKPDLGSAYGDLAVAANENKNYPLAIKSLDERAKYLPELPVTYFLRATAYDHLRAYKQAAENYHRFLEVAAGQYPDQEWQARHRLIAIEPEKR